MSKSDEWRAFLTISPTIERLRCQVGRLIYQTSPMAPPAKEDILLTSDLAGRLRADLTTLTFLRASQNVVYEFKDRTGAKKILRLTPQSHRSRSQIEQEVGWIDWLAKRGLPVCCAQESHGGRRVFPVEGAGEGFHGVVFEHAPGRAVVAEDLKPDFYRMHGAALGSLHSCVRSSSSPFVMSARTPWDEERYFTRDIHAYLPERFRDPVLRRFGRLREQVVGASLGAQEYGPVHFDLGYSNFFVHKREVVGEGEGSRAGLWLFDFDNATPGPFVGDVAAALYSSVFIGLRRRAAGDRSAFEPPRTGLTLEEVWGPFREGYEAHHRWPESWAEQLSRWMEIHFLRAIVHAHRMLHPIRDEGIRALLEHDLQNFLAGTPPLNFDFRTGKAV